MWTGRLGTAFAVAGTVTVLGTALGAPATAADDKSYTCEAPHRFCSIFPAAFPGGRISIDADDIGTPDNSAHWALSRYDSDRRPIAVCHGDFRVVNPPRSWTCGRVPRADLALESWIDGPSQYTLKIGVRW